MPSIVVQIEWDVPVDPDWVDDLSIELALAEYCPESLLTVTDVGDVVDALRGLLEPAIPEDRPYYMRWVLKQDKWFCNYCNCENGEHGSDCPVAVAKAALAALEAAE